MASADAFTDPYVEPEVQLMSDLVSGMRHNSYDDHERYGSGSYYSL